MMAIIPRPPDQVIAALIVGTCTMVATFIKIRVDMRMARAAAVAVVTTRQTKAARRKRRRKLLILVAGGALGLTLIVHGALGLRERHLTAMARGLLPSAAIAQLAAAVPIVPRDGTIESQRETWLNAEGMTIYYRTTEYLPSACPGKPDARGNWGNRETDFAPVHCSGEWLLFDVTPLLEAGRVVRNVTYCVNFTDGDGVWGRHAVEAPPGFEDISVPSTRIPLGRAIGFRVSREGPMQRVRLTAEHPRAAC